MLPAEAPAQGQGGGVAHREVSGGERALRYVIISRDLVGICNCKTLSQVEISQKQCLAGGVLHGLQEHEANPWQGEHPFLLLHTPYTSQPEVACSADKGTDFEGKEGEEGGCLELSSKVLGNMY